MRKVKGILKQNEDIVWFIIILIIKLIASNFILGFSGIGYYTIFGCLGSILFFVGISFLFEGNNRTRFLLVSLCFFDVAIYLNTIFNRCYGDIFSSGVFFHKNYMEIILNSFGYIRIYDVLFFIDIFVFLYILKRLKFLAKISSYKWSIIGFAVFSFIGILLSYVSIDSLNKTQPGILKNFYDKKTIAKEAGLSNYGFLDLKRQVEKMVDKGEQKKGEKYIKSLEKLNEYFDNPNDKEHKYSGIAKGKNLIVIQLEAFQGFLLNRSIDGVEITPNLNKLSKESINFNNYYYQIGAGGTSDAEFLSNTSLLPLNDTSVYTDFSSNDYESLPIKLKEKGYFTSVMHANRPGFWNRYLMYDSLGFDVFESERKFNNDEKLILGLSDESFFNQGIEKIKSYKQPFYTFMITLTSHYPFMDSKGKLNSYMDVGSFEGTLTGNFIKSARYTDEMLGKFIEGLKREGLYDNTIIALYGDHGAVSTDRRGELSKLLYNRDTMSNLEWEESQKVVSMIHIPGSNIKGEMDIVAGQYDLYPTLANLLGIETKYTLGRDLLNSKSGFAVNSGGNIFTDDVIFISKDNKLYSRKDQSILEKEEHFNIFNKCDLQNNISRGIIKWNILNDLLK